MLKSEKYVGPFKVNDFIACNKTWAAKKLIIIFH